MESLFAMKAAIFILYHNFAYSANQHTLRDCQTNQCKPTV